MSIAADYDARRVSDTETADSTVLRELAPVLPLPSATVADDDDAQFIELPGADLSGEELSVVVIPQRADEFTCTSCYLVQHRSRLRSAAGSASVCADCF